MTNLNYIQVKILDNFKTLFDLALATNTEYKQLKQGSLDSAGFDLLACIPDKVYINPLEAIWIPTGIAIYIKDKNYAGFVYPRSGKGGNYGLVLGNLTGIIDSDYQGELKVSVLNRNDNETIVIKPGDAIAQIVFQQVAHPNFTIVSAFSNETIRGTDGFGSTDGDTNE